MKKIQLNNLTMIVNKSFGVVVVVTIFVISTNIVKLIQAEISDTTNPTLRLLLEPLVKNMKNDTSKGSMPPLIKPTLLDSNDKIPIMKGLQSPTICPSKGPLEEIQDICCSKISKERFPSNIVHKKVYEIRCEGERIAQLLLHMMTKSFKMTNQNKGFLGNINTPAGKELVNSMTSLVRKINILPISLLTQQGNFDVEDIFEILQGGSPSCGSPNTATNQFLPWFNPSDDSGSDKILPRLYQMFGDFSNVAPNQLVPTIETIINFVRVGLEFLPSLINLLSGANSDDF